MALAVHDGPKYTKEQINFFRMSYLVHNIVPEGLRRVFRQEWDFRYITVMGEWRDTPKNGRDFFSMETRKSRVKNARLLATIQNGNVEEWDFTTLIFAILYSDSIGATISSVVQIEVDGLRKLRNGIAHLSKAELTDGEFQTYVRRVLAAFSALHLPVNAVEDVVYQGSFKTDEVEALEREVDMLKQELAQVLQEHASPGHYSKVSKEEESETVASSSSQGTDENAWIQGRYLGSGAYGKVYACTFPATGAELAVKVVTIDSHRSEEIKELENEIDVLRNLRNERIVPFRGSERKDNCFYLFMDFMAGGSLYDYIKRNGILSEDLSRKYTRQILEGLSFLHSKKVVHRDVKGANVLLDGDGNAKLADFGVARKIETIGSKTRLESFRGTVFWMAPEVITAGINSDGYGRKADVWSLGCTLLEMLTGNPPWHNIEPQVFIFKFGSNLIEPVLPEDISQDAKDFLRAALTRDPTERPYSEQLLHHPFVLGSTVITEDQENQASSE